MPRKSPVKPVTPADPQKLDVEITVAGARPRRKPQSAECPPERRVGPARIPRISRLMALAIKFDDMIARGEVRDYADLARLGYVTRARTTQIMNLLHLAPELQEEILFLNDGSAHTIAERDLRPVLLEVDWDRQRCSWRDTADALRSNPRCGKRKNAVPANNKPNRVGPPD
jgi:hypothetical protein